MGVGLANGAQSLAWHSPLAQLPSPYWKGVTLDVGPQGTGTLTIGPVTPTPSAVAVPMQRATPSRYRGGRPAFQKDLKLCWRANRGRRVCAQTDMDLGSPSPVFDPSALPEIRVVDHRFLAPGTRVTATTRSGHPIWSFTAGDDDATDLTSLIAQSYTEFNTGIHFFFDHVVAYDVAHARFLLAPRG